MGSNCVNRTQKFIEGNIQNKWHGWMNEWINEWNENWKNDKLDYIKKENFCSLKNTVKG